jgi:hypothetical protein
MNVSPIPSKMLQCVLHAGVLTLTTGCAADAVFKSRFSSCIARIEAAERGPQMTVFPAGDQKTDYCVRYARDRGWQLP